MASASRTAALVIAWMAVLLLLWALFAGLAAWGDTLREKHCDRFSRTHARIEAAERGEPDPGQGGKGEDACVHEHERAAKPGSGA